MKYLLVLSIFLLAACGGGGSNDDTTTPTVSKDVIENTYNADLAVVIDSTSSTATGASVTFTVSSLGPEDAPYKTLIYFDGTLVHEAERPVLDAGSLVTFSQGAAYHETPACIEVVLENWDDKEFDTHIQTYEVSDPDTSNNNDSTCKAPG